MKLFIVDDDRLFRNRLVQSMLERGHETVGFEDASTSLAKYSTLGPEAVIVDLRMPGISGLEAVTQFRAQSASIKIVVLTGYGSISTALEAVKRGADDYLTKPINPDQLQAVLLNNKTLPAPTAAVPTLAQIEWDHIQRVLQGTGGNITHAAKLLNIPRRTLQRKLSKDPGQLV